MRMWLNEKQIYLPRTFGKDYNILMRYIPRDISWLSFNARVLQEAADPTVPLKNRIRFLAIHSSNLNEFFSTRVPALKAQIKLEIKQKEFKAAEKTQSILNEIHSIVIQQQAEFSQIWRGILTELHKRKINLLTEKELTKKQIDFINAYYDSEISPNIIPLFMESLPPLTSIWAKNIFLAVVMRSKDKERKEKYAIIEIPTKKISRFLLLPSKNHEQNIILLEDIIRFNLPKIFSSFGYDAYEANLFKVTQDAEIDLESDLSENYLKRIESGLKKRRKSEPICFLYDKEMDSNLLEYLIKWLNLSKLDSIIPRGRIRNFRDFYRFPAIFPDTDIQLKPFPHPDLAHAIRVSDVVLQRDILLCPPYHSFNAIIDMLREAAMDSSVKTIKLTAYRLAQYSMVCNALINAARNGKQVQVIMELKATYDEEANLNWKTKLEEEGVKVYIGVPNLKIHTKICLIKRVINNKPQYYGFIGTGNLNEETALIYADYFLLTSNKKILSDINNIFKALKNPTINWKKLKECKTLIVSPVAMRKELTNMIDREIKNKLNARPAGIYAQMNALCDEQIIEKLYEAARVGVPIRLVVRSIMSAIPNQKSFKRAIVATSIVDRFLEHGRLWVFENNNNKNVFITSADWMLRNMNYRVEVAVRIEDEVVKKQLLDILNIKFNDNVKARILDNESSNKYVKNNKPKTRSQLKIYQYLSKIKPTKNLLKKGIK